MTGAAGFIGQHLVSELLDKNYRVRAMVRPERGTDSRISIGCEQVPIGLTDVTGLAPIIAESSAVIYCAGSVRGRSHADFALANIEGVKAMLTALELAEDAPPMLLVSSLAASKPHLSDYARSKYDGEQLLRDKPQLPWTIIRPPAVYGPGDKEMLPLLKMIRRGFLAHPGPDDQRLSLLHVDDLSNAVASWLSQPRSCLHRTFAIDDGTPGGYSWNDIGEAVSEKDFRLLKLPDFLLAGSARINLLLSTLLGYSPMLTPGKVNELNESEWLCDNRDFEDMTDWRPRLNLQRGAELLFGSD